MAQTSPEIRFRIDRDERTQFEQVAQRLGMDANDMVKVFIRRSIAAGGFPFDMRAPANDEPAPAERFLPVHGVSLGHLAGLGARAAALAHGEHLQAGRLPPLGSGCGVIRPAGLGPWHEEDAGRLNLPTPRLAGAPPRLVMVAGPNGSGKSTLIAALRADPLVQLPGLYVNADDLQRDRGLADSMDAQKLATQLRAQALAEQADVMYETVMSHPAKLAELQVARAAGYHVTVHLVATDDPAINEARVQARVEAGGHAVPPERIRARYARTLALAPIAIAFAHQAVVFDNTLGGDTGSGLALQAALANGQLELVTAAPMAWVSRLVALVDERTRALQALAQDTVIELAQLRRSSTTGAVVAIDAHHVLQRGKGGANVLHDRILLGAAAEPLAVGERCRIRYRDGVAEIDFPGKAGPRQAGQAH